MKDNRISPGPTSSNAAPIVSPYEQGKADERARIADLAQLLASGYKSQGLTRSARIATDIGTLLSQKHD